MYDPENLNEIVEEAVKSEPKKTFNFGEFWTEPENPKNVEFRMSWFRTWYDNLTPELQSEVSQRIQGVQMDYEYSFGGSLHETVCSCCSARERGEKCSCEEWVEDWKDWMCDHEQGLLPSEDRTDHKDNNKIYSTWAPGGWNHMDHCICCEMRCSQKECACGPLISPLHCDHKSRGPKLISCDLNDIYKGMGIKEIQYYWIYPDSTEYVGEGFTYRVKEEDDITVTLGDFLRAWNGGKKFTKFLQDETKFEKLSHHIPNNRGLCFEVVPFEWNPTWKIRDPRKKHRTG